MTDGDADDKPEASLPMPMLLRAGIACALVGIVVGGVLAYRNLGSLGDLMSVPAYGHYMIPPLLLGGIAVGIAIAETVRTGRYARPLAVFGLGLVAMATPLLLGIALAVFVMLIVVVILSEMS